MFVKKLSQVSKFQTTGFTSEQLWKPEKVQFHPKWSNNEML